MVSLAGTRGGAYAAGLAFPVPDYVVGNSGHLRIYLDGVLCAHGPDGSYTEVGAPGESSGAITWNFDVPDTFDIEAIAIGAADGTVAIP
jgi:hypothetical protein